MGQALLGLPENYFANAAAPVVQGIGSALKQQFQTPGAVMQPAVPEQPGMWSDVDEAKKQLREKNATDNTIGMATSLVGGGTPLAEEGAAGIFGGRLAKTAPLHKAANSPGLKTWDPLPYQPGDWFRGHERRAKFEIPDTDARVRIQPNAQFLGDYLQHPDLYKAYPSLQDIKVIHNSKPGNAYYQYTRENPKHGLERISINPEDHPVDLRSLLLHEAQHGVQAREGFDLGWGGQEAMEPIALKAMQEHGMLKTLPSGNVVPLGKQGVGDLYKTLDEAAKEAYMRQGAEVEARNVQRRANDPTLYNQHPYLTEDRHKEVQIPGGRGSPVPVDRYFERPGVRPSSLMSSLLMRNTR
jgi:hypothetical protein